ncbi:hypothetical protein GCM10009792_19770 [Microcella alkalica]|uniref:Threonine synthase n=1 Tax=Microcella alkalica TaxID=355930 RepID=A0A839EDJ1_9MICO|nr:DUF2188 domain-containing protein [Microcella alkalica]MBA8847395.1 threonine synthase [Microcella alkalica]
METLVQLLPRRGVWIVRVEGRSQSIHDSEDGALESARAVLERTGGMILVHSATGAIVHRETVETAIVHRVLARV